MGRNRVLALWVTGAFLGGLRWLAPEPAQRAAWLYLVALPLGYGHLIGAALFARSRRWDPRAPAASRWLLRAFVAWSLFTLFAAYLQALRSASLQPWVLAPILVLFGWHIAENDLALGRAYREGLRLGPVARAVAHHGIAAVLTAGVGLAAFSTREGAVFSRAYFGAALVPPQGWLTLDELTAGFLLYHTLSWWLFFEDRVRSLRTSAPAQAARLRRRVLAFHAVPLGINAVLYLGLPALHVYVAAPAFYLFWSSAHTLHTAWVRGLAPRASPP
jgi:hypothetical protein